MVDIFSKSSEAAEDDGDWEEIRWAPPNAINPVIFIDSRADHCWASARMLAEWLRGPGSATVSNCDLLVELGASLGLPTLAACCSGARRGVATDLYLNGEAKALMRTIEFNPDLNIGDRVSAQSLDWYQVPETIGELRGAADVALCADVIYAEKAAPAIVEAAAAVLRENGLMVFVSRYGRRGLDKFLQHAIDDDQAPFILLEQADISSPSMGLGITETELHGRWMFKRKPL